MKKKIKVIPTERIERSILLIRGQKVRKRRGQPLILDIVGDRMMEN
ncbi:MAG: hypothetical protein NT009_09050 [Proteobacteria bacterium]|nr:hypothetical protein [Pseudomonadota bacterium]